MIITVEHVTHYDYQGLVWHNTNELRLLPRPSDRQTILGHSIRIEPETKIYTWRDWLGNNVHGFTLRAPHASLRVASTLTVRTTQAPPWDEQHTSVSFADLDNPEVSRDFIDFLLPSRYVPYDSEPPAKELAELNERLQNCIGERARHDAFAYVLGLSRTIPVEFTYEAGVTSVTSTVTDLLREGRGVCQDFSHLMIALCRMRGIPARYVGGYQLQPGTSWSSPDGERAHNMETEHMNHAWVEVYLPGLGWLALDPTNALVPDERYVRVAVGRDYADVAPIKGSYRSLGNTSGAMTVQLLLASSAAQ